MTSNATRRWVVGAAAIDNVSSVPIGDSMINVWTAALNWASINYMTPESACRVMRNATIHALER